MPDHKLHIVSFDIPYPPDYGGAIDVFYKVKQLAGEGIEIYLHCPQYGNRKPSELLETLCAKVFYYKRNTGFRGISLKTPYMVSSRCHEELLRNLIHIEAPILFDGVSTSCYLNHTSLKDRIRILRPQNIEQDYYRLLAKREKNVLKKLYYQVEAVMLRDYEYKLNGADAFFTVALQDHAFFRQKYPGAVHEYIPSFHPYDDVSSEAGKGEFCLYHGNLGLAENKEAAHYLLSEIIPQITYPFIIAGRNPGRDILEKAKKLPHCRIVPNPSMEEMTTLIRTAQIHVLPTFQNTGLKLKLLHALFSGRHVIVNEGMVYGTGLSSVCHVCGDSDEFIDRIDKLKDVAFDQKDISERRSVLSEHYDNKKNAQKIVTFLQRKSP